MNRRSPRGQTFIELLISLMVFGIVLSIGVALFITAERTYGGGTQEIDVQTQAMQGIVKLTQEIQESSLSGIALNVSHNAILLISARNSNGVFQYYSGSRTAYAGAPNWQKWVAYYLTPQANTPPFKLIRKEGNPLGSALPADPPVVPAIPAGWETSFRNASLNSKMIAFDVQNFDLESVNCANLINPLYLQLLTQATYGQAASSYNPGIPVSFSCPGKSGNWVRIQVRN